MGDLPIVGVAYGTTVDQALELAIEQGIRLADQEGRPLPSAWRFYYRHDIVMGLRPAHAVWAVGVEEGRAV